MEVILDHDRAALLHGDCKDLASVLAENSVDALVADPPAGIDFMGKGWDSDKGGRDKWVAWLVEALAPSFRALKPGGHGLIWALPRTSHWTAWALELAGFEIRDRVSHLFGTGFPKSLTSKSSEIPEDTGTALKPAMEDWWLVRKPLEGTVAANYAKWGTGILNIGGCRIGEEIISTHSRGQNGAFPKRPSETSAAESGRSAEQDDVEANPHSGRWPAHLVLDEEAAELLDEQSGELKSGELKSTHNVADVEWQPSKGAERGRKFKNTPPSIGGASRFFYVAKASRAEKDAGLAHLPKRTGGEATDRAEDSAGLANPRAGAGRTGGARNFHPTVKNVALMKWLCRLITPPGGTVLDPFVGSGTTGVAALAEGFSFIGSEYTEEYLPILLGRIRHALGIPPV